MKTFLVHCTISSGDEDDPDVVIGVVNAESQEEAEKKLGIFGPEADQFPGTPYYVYLIEAFEISSHLQLAQMCTVEKCLKTTLKGY